MLFTFEYDWKDHKEKYSKTPTNGKPFHFGAKFFCHRLFPFRNSSMSWRSKRIVRPNFSEGSSPRLAIR